MKGSKEICFGTFSKHSVVGNIFGYHLYGIILSKNGDRNLRQTKLWITAMCFLERTISVRFFEKVHSNVIRHLLLLSRSLNSRPVPLGMGA